MAKNQSRLIYTLFFTFISISKCYCTFNKDPFSFVERKKVFLQTRKLVGFKEYRKSNSGKGGVDQVINYTKLYKYDERPYCGATVKFCLEKSGFKIPKDVKNPLKAREWFRNNTEIIYVNGQYRGLYKTKPRLCDLVGFNFYGKNITHVGFYLWHLKVYKIRSFEGNTSKPGDRNIEGFFDKERGVENIVIRRLHFK